MIKSAFATALLTLTTGLTFDSDFGAIPDQDPNRIVRAPANLGTDEDSAPRTCTLSIERSIVGPHDYKSIIGSGKRFEDSWFNPNTEAQIVWPEHALSGSISLKPQLSKL